MAQREYADLPIRKRPLAQRFSIAFLADRVGIEPTYDAG
jgi:hypothetical protein